MAPGRLRKWGIESPQRKGDSFMEIGTLRIVPTPESIQELDRLGDEIAELAAHLDAATGRLLDLIREFDARGGGGKDRKSTRLNSSHLVISYAVFCFKKKNKTT